MSTADQRRIIALLDRHFAGVHARLDQLEEEIQRLTRAAAAMHRDLRRTPPVLPPGRSAVRVGGGWIQLPLGGQRKPGRA